VAFSVVRFLFNDWPPHPVVVLSRTLSVSRSRYWRLRQVFLRFPTTLVVIFSSPKWPTVCRAVLNSTHLISWSIRSIVDRQATTDDVCKRLGIVYRLCTSTCLLHEVAVTAHC